MDKAKQKKAIEFMFVEIDKPIWWQPPALTKAGNDVPTSPDLNPSEAQSIFRLLAEKGLIFPAINERNEPCFLLHSAKKDDLMRRRYSCLFIFYLLCLIFIWRNS